EAKRIDYLLAQLADPEFVDARVQNVHGGKFDEQVEETREEFRNDPNTIKLFRRFLQDGTWDVQEKTASARVKDTSRAVYFKKIGGRWFLENRYQEAAGAPAKEK